MEKQHFTQHYHENHVTQTEHKERQWFYYFCILSFSWIFGSWLASLTPREDFSALIFFANLPVMLLCLVIANFKVFSEPKERKQNSAIQKSTGIAPYKYAYTKLLKTMDGLILFNVIMGLLLFGTDNSNWVLLFGLVTYFIFYLIIIVNTVFYQIRDKKNIL